MAIKIALAGNPNCGKTTMFGLPASAILIAIFSYLLNPSYCNCMLLTQLHFS